MRPLRILPLAAALILVGCGKNTPAPPPGAEGRIVIEYWEKWSGFEGEAMQAVVDDFNASQDRIFVNKTNVSGLDQKLLLATAGGNPPDVSGLYSYILPDFASKGGLTPLDPMLKEAGISRDDYIPVFWDLGTYEGFVWALPTTPATVALHWNKSLFRDAGLNPERPPQSLAELEEMSDRLTVVVVERNGNMEEIPYLNLTDQEKADKDFSIVRIGHLPQEPGWWLGLWVFWHGGGHMDGEKMALDSPEMLATWKWFDQQVDKYGIDNLQAFRAGFGNFASPQNPFLSGRVGMVLQGVWMHNFIEKYAPDMEWSAAPFPTADPARFPNVTIAETDQVVIPRGSRHPREAFEFICYLNSQKAMEKLNMAQRKFSALATTSDTFISEHPNPQIEVFIDLAQSPNARVVPRLPIWREIEPELRVSADRVFNRLASPEEALADCQRRSSRALERNMQIWNRVREKRIRQWSAYEPD